MNQPGATQPGADSPQQSTEKPDAYADCESVGVEVFGLKEAA